MAICKYQRDFRRKINGSIFEAWGWDGYLPVASCSWTNLESSSPSVVSAYRSPLYDIGLSYCTSFSSILGNSIQLLPFTLKRPSYAVKGTPHYTCLFRNVILRILYFNKYSNQTRDVSKLSCSFILHRKTASTSNSMKHRRDLVPTMYCSRFLFTATYHELGSRRPIL